MNCIIQPRLMTNRVRISRDLFRSVGQNNKERILYSAAGLREAFFRCAGPGLGQQCTVNPLLSFVNSFETMQGKTLDELGPDSLAIYSRDPFYHNNRDPQFVLVCNCSR